MAAGAAAGAVAGLMIANNVARLTRDMRTATDSWKSLESRGLALDTEKVSGVAAASGPSRPFLAGTVDGCRVEVHVRSDTVHYATTEVVAKPPEGLDALVGVHPSPGGVLGYLRSWLGQDIQVGDERFDEAFLVTAKPESAAKVLLGEALRERIEAIDRSRLAGFTYAKDRVLVLLHWVETDATIVGAAISAATAAASFRL